MQRSLLVAKICGALPLAVGLLVFAVWLPTRWDWLIPFGIFVLYAGVFLFLVGAIALARFATIALRDPNHQRKRIWQSIRRCGLLLLANFVVAGGIVFAVAAIHTSYVVTVRNNSPASIKAVTLFGGGCEVTFGEIKSGAEAKGTFWIKHEGALRVRATIDGVVREATIDDYVTANIGGKTRVIVDDSGLISSQRL